MLPDHNNTCAGQEISATSVLTVMSSRYLKKTPAAGFPVYTSLLADLKTEE